MALSDHLSDWSSLSRLQQVVIAGAGLVLVLHVVVTALIVGFMVSVASIGNGLSVLRNMIQPALIILGPALVGAALIVWLTVKIGGPDQPLKPLRTISVSYFLVPELSWLSMNCVAFYSIFFDTDVSSWDFVQPLAFLSIGALLLGIIGGFAVWGVTAVVSNE